MVLRKLLTPIIAGWVVGKALDLYMDKKSTAQRKTKRDHKVDTALEDSFPASDPPSWNYVHSLGAPKAGK